MTPLQEAFIAEVQENEKPSLQDYITLYNKYCDLAAEDQIKQGADAHRAKVMSEYYILKALTKVLGNKGMVEKIQEQREPVAKA